MTISERIEHIKAVFWKWLVQHAQSKYALPWLAFVAFTDAIISPLAPEIFLVALTLAHKSRWRQYLSVAIASTTIGAICGYVIATFLFREFGDPLLQFYGLGGAFETARNLIIGHVFVAMAVASFTPIPDKVFIYAGGFLGAPFIPFITGYVLGRALRMAIVVYLVHRFGQRSLEIFNKYLLWFSAILLAVAVGYGIVHLHLLP